MPYLSCSSRVQIKYFNHFSWPIALRPIPWNNRVLLSGPEKIKKFSNLFLGGNCSLWPSASYGLVSKGLSLACRQAEPITCSRCITFWSSDTKTEPAQNPTYWKIEIFSSKLLWFSGIFLKRNFKLYYSGSEHGSHAARRIITIPWLNKDDDENDAEVFHFQEQRSLRRFSTKIVPKSEFYAWTLGQSGEVFYP